jgi:alkaline phosphatase D
MGLNGTDAIATLIALNSVSTLATTIGTTATSTGGNIAVAAAIVAAMTAGAGQLTAVSGGSSIAAAIAGGANPVAAAEAAGLTVAQANIAVAAYRAAASASGTSAQVAAAAQTIAFGYIKPDIQTSGTGSRFLPAQYAPYCTKFLFDCDQWDGYDAERRDLMAYLKSHGIRNVVAITGDIHAFHAGLVYDNYDASSGTPVIVDLVTAGISSDSSFNYYADASDELGNSLSTLVYYPLSIPVPGVGTISIRFDLFDFTLAKAAPTLDQLAEQARVQVRGALAAAGVPESGLDATTDAVLAGLKSDSNFSGSLLALATQLAGLNNNPWIKFVNTDAQGYAVVNLTRNGLTCTFRQMNKLVADGVAPTSPRVARSTTLRVAAASVALTVS